MAKIPHIITHAGNISAVVNNKPYNVARDHANYDAIRQAVYDGNADEFLKLVDVVKSVQKFTFGNVSIVDNEVSWKGHPIHSVMADRLLTMMRENVPYENFIKFMENLMENPSKNSVEQLYSFLEHKGLPITDDGHFLAYKRVREDWTDFHTGKISYKIRETVNMPRNMVSDDPNSHCSYGLHAGAMEYVQGFNSGGHVLLVKINPRDVVSVPNDHSCTKLRCCELVVVDEVQETLDKSCYATTNNGVAPVTMKNSDVHFEIGDIVEYDGEEFGVVDVGHNEIKLSDGEGWVLKEHVMLVEAVCDDVDCDDMDCDSGW